MDVEDPKLALADVPKAVKHSCRCGHPCSWASMDEVIAELELSLSFEHIERINVIAVAVWINAESGAKASIDDFELWQLDEYSVVARTARDLLPLVRGNMYAGHRRSISPSRVCAGSRLALPGWNDRAAVVETRMAPDSPSL
jgi:hypothetical protein